jgi:hypothetical protein
MKTEEKNKKSNVKYSQEIRDKVSSEMSKMSKEELKIYIAKRLSPVPKENPEK